MACPSCSELVNADFISSPDAGNQIGKTTVKGFKSSSILNRIQLENFQTSTKIEALVCLNWPNYMLLYFNFVLFSSYVKDLKSMSCCAVPCHCFAGLFCLLLMIIVMGFHLVITSKGFRHAETKSHFTVFQTLYVFSRCIELQIC